MTKFTLILAFLASACLWAQDAAVPAAPAAPAGRRSGTDRDDGSARFRARLPRFFRDPAGNRDAHPHLEVPQADGNHPPTRHHRDLAGRLHRLEKRREATSPKNRVLITFDDGWKSVYTDAFPILKEFGYPFTLFLYKNYVDGGGKALTTPMIQEMIKAGATIGSHSVSHPYPITVKSFRKKGPDAYDAFLRKEMGESKRFLESKFAVKVTTYSYPGGFFTEEMIAARRRSSATPTASPSCPEK